MPHLMQSSQSILVAQVGADVALQQVTHCKARTEESQSSHPATSQLSASPGQFRARQFTPTVRAELREPQAQHCLVTAVRAEPSWVYPAESTSTQFSPNLLPKEILNTVKFFIQLCWNSLHFCSVLHNA